MSEQPKDRWRYWKNLGSDIHERCVPPVEQPTFVIYFLLITLLISGLGVIIPISKLFVEPNPQNLIAVPQALATYSLAILAAAFIDLSFSIFTDLSKRSLWMFSLLLATLGVILAVVSYLPLRLRWAYICASVGALLAILLWWMANSDNAKLLEHLPRAIVATGGPTDEIEGSTDDVDFNVKEEK